MFHRGSTYRYKRAQILSSSMNFHKLNTLLQPTLRSRNNTSPAPQRLLCICFPSPEIATTLTSNIIDKFAYCQTLCKWNRCRHSGIWLPALIFSLWQSTMLFYVVMVCSFLLLYILLCDYTTTHLFIHATIDEHLSNGQLGAVTYNAALGILLRVFRWTGLFILVIPRRVTCPFKW